MYQHIVIEMIGVFWTQKLLRDPLRLGRTVQAPLRQLVKEGERFTLLRTR